MQLSPTMTPSMALSHVLVYFPLAQAPATENWLVKWASPFFLVGLGILFGLILLGLFMVVVKALSKMPAWENLTRNPSGHVVAALLTAAIASAACWAIQIQGFGGNNNDSNERTLVFIAAILLCAIVGWGIVFCAGKKSAQTLLSTLSEGASRVLAVVVLMTMVIGLLAGLLFREPMKAITSIPRIFQTGTFDIVKKIPGIAANVNAEESPLVESKLEVEPTLLLNMRIKSDRKVVLGDAGRSIDFAEAPRTLPADEEIAWNRKDGKSLPVPIGEGRTLHIQNREVDDATVTFTITTIPPIPEATTILISAAIIFLTGVFVLLQQAIAPRASAVAFATVKNELAQPLFLVLFSLGACLIILFVFLSFYTFGEDIKLLKECGIVVIMLLAAFQGIWSASSSISEEIEGRTALTVLSKPIERRSFVLGKFLGIFWVVTVLFVMLGAIELAAVAYKPIYEARENSLEQPMWQDCHREMVSTVPGLALGLLQATVLSSISVALATRLPQLVNIAVCFGVYLVGHLATAIVSGANEGFPIVKFIAQLVSTLIPILEHFQMQAAIDADRAITMSLLSGTLIYCLLYIMLSMFLALLLFEDRDLA